LLVFLWTMAKPKYKEYFERMLLSEKELFEEFKDLHARYGMDENNLQDEYNKLGEKVLNVIRDWEDKLCKNTERGMYNKYSSSLSEKFQKEIKKHFPLIDHVGLINDDPEGIVFNKINLK